MQGASISHAPFTSFLHPYLMDLRMFLNKKVAAAAVAAQMLAGGYAALPIAEKLASAASPFAITLVGPQTAAPGQTISYSVTVKNNGNFTVTGAKLMGGVPAQLTLLANQSTGGCAMISSTVFSCTPVSYAPGQTRTFTLVYMVKSNTAVGTVIDNVVDVWSDNADANWSNHFFTTVVAGGTGGGSNTTNVNANANTSVNNTINAAAQNNTTVNQQSQQNMPWNTWQTATVNPTANVGVTNTVNAGAQNNTQIWQPANPFATNTANVSTTANTGVNNAINAGALNNTAVWQQGQMNLPWGGGQAFTGAPTANAWVNSSVTAGSMNNTSVWH